MLYWPWLDQGWFGEVEVWGRVRNLAAFTATEGGRNLSIVGPQSLSIVCIALCSPNILGDEDIKGTNWAMLTLTLQSTRLSLHYGMSVNGKLMTSLRKVHLFITIHLED